jgi:hypothetical protein
MKAKVLTHFYGKLDRNMTTETTTQVVIARIKTFFDRFNYKFADVLKNPMVKEQRELHYMNHIAKCGREAYKKRNWADVFKIIDNANNDANYRDNYAAMDLQMYELKNGRL